MALRAVQLDNDGIICNIIMVDADGLNERVLQIPTMTLDDGSVIELPVNIGESKWDGTQFLNLDNSVIQFEIPAPVTNEGGV